jgi:hypothetical protein
MTNPHNQDDTMPPDADMYDDLPEESYEEDSAEGDTWSDEYSDQESSGPAEKPKKKSSLFTIIVIVLAVVGGGVVLMTQFGGGGQVPPQQVASDSPEPAGQAGAEAPVNDLTALQTEAPSLDAPSAEGQAATAQPPEQPSGGGFMNDPAVLGSVSGQSSETVVPPAMSPETIPAPVALPDAGPSLTAPPAQMMGDAASVPQPDPAQQTASDTTSPSLMPITPVSDFPSVDVIKKAGTPEDTAAAPVPEVVAVPDVSVDAPISSTESAPSLSVEATVPTSESPVIAPASSTAVSGVDAAALSEMQKKLDDALEKIQSLEADLQAADQKIDNQSAAAEKAVALQKKIDELESRLKNIPKTAKAEKEPSPAPEVSLPDEPSKVVTQAPMVMWELRSAQPGTAMVARQGQDDVRTVSVGDTLPSVGRITAIEQSPNGWVVTGTLGSIRQ